VWLFVRASCVLAASQGEKCQGQTRNWLLTFICLQLSGPLCTLSAAIVRRFAPHRGRLLLQLAWPISLIVLMLWSIIAVVYLSPPPACPPLRTMTVKAVALQSTSLLCLAISFVYLLAAHPIILRLNELAARGGILSEAANVVAEIPIDDLPAKEECAICLGCVEDYDNEVEDEATPLAQQETSTGSLSSFSSLASEDDLEKGQALQTIDLEADSPTTPPKPRPPWRRLKCGHRFHEQCLFQWLRKAKRCPLCRCHMREVPSWRRNQLAETAAASSNASSSVAVAPSSAPTLQHGDPADASAESSGSADPLPVTVLVTRQASSSCSSNDMVSPLPNICSDAPSGCDGGSSWESS
jgi:hypothetical protein